MDLQELFARSRLGTDQSGDYIQWAEEELARGRESPSLAILAGLDTERPIDRTEVERYFEKAVAELGMARPADRDAALGDYARRLCERVMQGQVSPRTVLEQLADLYRATGYADALFSIWYSLAEDVSLLDDGEAPLFDSCGFSEICRGCSLNSGAPGGATLRLRWRLA